MNRCFTSSPGAANQEPLFRMRPSECEDADVTICEAPQAYEEFWRPLYGREFVPKFLVSSWLTASDGGDVHYVGGFQLMPNLWHSVDGPGEHAGSPSVQRWIAWYVPPHGRRVVEATLAGRDDAGAGLTCVSRRVTYNYGVPYAFDDESQSDVPMVDECGNRVLHTVRDLRAEDAPALRELRSKVVEVFRERFGAAPEDLAMYFHYPVRARLALVHLHVCLGHKEVGVLAARSHELDQVLKWIDETGSYDNPRLFQEYHLSYDKDGSLQHILHAMEQPTTKADRLVDLVVPCAPKDAELLPLCLRSLRRCCSQLRRVVVLSPSQLVPDDEAEWFDEALFPFLKADFGTAWRYQQALKLCAPFVVPGLLDDVLVVDADTVWHREGITFVQPDGVALYATSGAPGDVEGYAAFFEGVLQPLGLRRLRRGESAITHHMLFQRQVLAALFVEIRRRLGKPVWRVLAEGKPSEWELYYHFAFSRFPRRVAHRPLRFVLTDNVYEAVSPANAQVDFAVCHSHRRLGIIDTHDDGDYHYPLPT